MIEEIVWNKTLELSNQEKQKELDSVLKSVTFARSEQLRSFLLYVCRMETEGRAEDLNEYLVGVEALGRPASYSPTEDSSVRSRAWELRQKLLKLYSTERRDSTLRIDLPRGGYAPEYLVCTRKVEEESHFLHPIDLPEKQFQSPSPAVAKQKGRYSILIGIFAGLAVVLAAFAANRFWKPASPDAIDPVIRQAWGPLLEPGSSDMLVMTNSLYLLVRPEVQPQVITSRRYSVPPEIYDEYKQKHPLARGTQLTMFTYDNAVQIGYVNSLITISGVLQRAAQPFNVIPERVVTPSEIRNRNVILFGAPQDSMEVTEVLRAGIYHFGYDPAHDIVIQKGKTPLSDSLYYAIRKGSPVAFVTYGLITVMPSLGADAQGKKTVVFSGITSVGAQGAAEFFASSQYMRDLRDRFRKRGTTGFPPAYQVLVRCRAYDNLLVSFEYVDSESLPQSK